MRVLYMPYLDKTMTPRKHKKTKKLDKMADESYGIHNLSNTSLAKYD
jgi:hypothetical protein